MIRRRFKWIEETVIAGLKRKGFDGTIDRLERGVIDFEQAMVELKGAKPEIVLPKNINPAEYAAELKRKGVERRESWSRWVQKTTLNPRMDAKDWYKIYDSVTL